MRWEYLATLAIVALSAVVALFALRLLLIAFLEGVRILQAIP